MFELTRQSIVHRTGLQQHQWQHFEIRAQTGIFPVRIFLHMLPYSSGCGFLRQFKHALLESTGTAGEGLHLGRCRNFRQLATQARCFYPTSIYQYYKFATFDLKRRQDMVANPSIANFIVEKNGFIA